MDCELGLSYSSLLASSKTIQAINVLPWNSTVLSALYSELLGTVLLGKFQRYIKQKIKAINVQ